MKILQRLAVICVVMFVGIGASACAGVGAVEADEIGDVSVSGGTYTYEMRGQVDENGFKTWQVVSRMVEITGLLRGDIVSYALGVPENWSEYHPWCADVGSYGIWVLVERAGFEDCILRADITIVPAAYNVDAAALERELVIWERPFVTYINKNVTDEIDIKALLGAEWSWGEIVDPIITPAVGGVSTNVFAAVWQYSGNYLPVNTVVTVVVIELLIK